jgi:hypothetical protein
MSEDQNQKAFEALRLGVRNCIDNLTTASAKGAGAEQVEGLPEGIEESLSELGSKIENLTIGTPSPSEGDIKILKSDLAAASGLLRALSIVNTQFRPNRTLLYQEAGQWARHYSTVRMTVLTFAITTCTAIVAWKWQSTGPKELETIAIPVGVMWTAGVLIFWVFTKNTYRQVRRQMEKRPLLPCSFGEDYGRRNVPIDGASFVIPILSGLFVYAVDKATPCAGIWIKTGLWSFVTLGIIVPLGIWCHLNEFNKWKWVLPLTALFAAGILASYFHYLHVSPGSFPCR